VGVLLATGIVLQHLALGLTTEAVTAFLTSLSTIFVPVVLLLVFGRRIASATWLAVALATPGVLLMSYDGAFSLGTGVLLGVACAVAFSFHLIFLNIVTPSDDPYRVNLAQFSIVAIACGLLAVFFARDVQSFDAKVLATPVIWFNILMLALFPTIVSFGLMTVFQPKVAPARAALIYLMEPIVAGLFAYAWTGREMTLLAIVGGAMILIANGVVEFLPSRSPPAPDKNLA